MVSRFVTNFLLRERARAFPTEPRSLALNPRTSSLKQIHSNLWLESQEEWTGRGQGLVRKRRSDRRWWGERVSRQEATCWVARKKPEKTERKEEVRETEWKRLQWGTKNMYAYKKCRSVFVCVWLDREWHFPEQSTCLWSCLATGTWPLSGVKLSK